MCVGTVHLHLLEQWEGDLVSAGHTGSQMSQEKDLIAAQRQLIA